MPSSTLVETAGLTAVRLTPQAPRLALAYACRQHLGTLFNDLRDISAGVDPSSSTPSDDVNSPCPSSPILDHLPSPALSPAPTRAAFAKMPWTVRWPASVSRTVFGACFSESCVLFLLVTFQAVDLLDARTRLLNWRISLVVLMCLMTIVVPLLQCLLVTYRSPVNLVTRIFLTLLPFFGYLFLLSFVSPPQTLASNMSTAYLARYVVLGVCILGLLSGFGATSAAWEFLVQPLLFARSPKWRNITEADIASTELALARIRQDLHQREMELARQASANGGPSSQQSTGWVSRVFGSSDTEAKILQTEMGSLRALEGEMGANLGRMRARRAELQFRASVGGALWLAAGRAFGCYCALRIASTILALVFHRSSAAASGSRSDVGAHVIGLVLPYVPLLPIAPSKENAEIIARHASLLLVGAIVLSSVRLVLRGVGRALKLTGKGRRSGQRNIGASIMLLFLAQIMGTYLLSTLIQLRTSFPGRSGRESELFASLPRYEPFEPAFNWAFLGAALAAGVARGIGWAGS
ncbi:hypothetical protein AURDEDRAFT_121592 [Auricularia subglabra TFB-10046 SS5]|nr:hypothetical protein AURDEDRAFT_121592 [Auricularia subglabra TFB-10046 SS5]